MVWGDRGPTSRSARSPGNPRERHLTRENVPLADVLVGYVTISRTGAPPHGPGGAPASGRTLESGRPRVVGRSRGPRPVVGAPAAVVFDPTTPFPEGSAAADCPNLPQRPRSRRSAGRESLIFRASSRRRSRLGAPLWQIWTRPGPGPPQKPHTSHRVGAPQRRTRTRSGDGAPTGHRPSLSGFIGPDTGSDPDSRRAAAGAAFRAASVEAAQSTMRTASPMYPRAGPGS